MISRVLRLISEQVHLVIFWMKNPRMIRTFTNNPRGLSLGRQTTGGLFSRFLIGKNSEIKIGDKVWLGRDVELQTWEGDKIEIGSYSSLQDSCKILGRVKIGKYSIIAPRIHASSGTHVFNYEPGALIREQDSLADRKALQKSVHIHEDVWIGVNVFIKAGVTIGRGVIIGANSVILKDVKPYEIVGGIPAKTIGQRLTFQAPSELTVSKDHLPYFYEGFLHLREEKGQRPTDAMWMEKEAMVAVPAQNSGKIEISFSVLPGFVPIEVQISLNDVAKKISLSAQSTQFSLDFGAIGFSNESSFLKFVHSGAAGSIGLKSMKFVER